MFNTLKTVFNGTLFCCHLVSTFKASQSALDATSANPLSQLCRFQGGGFLCPEMVISRHPWMALVMDLIWAHAFQNMVVKQKMDDSTIFHWLFY